MTGQPRDRIVTGNISLSLDGRVTGPAGDHDMGWIVPHALTSESRAHLLKITSTASTALLGRKNYQGFAGFWPAVAGDEGADPRDRAFARWLNEAEKVVVSRTLTEASWPGSRVVADDPAEVVRRLRKEEGGDFNKKKLITTIHYFHKKISPTPPQLPGSRVVADDPAEVVRRLRKEEGGTSSSWPARASSAACSRPASSTGSASRCARSWSGRAPACSATARRARRGR